MKILLVEDDAMIGRSLVRAFGDTGVSVDWVRDGSDGLAALGAAPYALVLLDLGLPKSSGLDLLKTMRRAGNTTAALIVTARDDIETRVAGLDLGADDFVTKPFDFEELGARVRAVVRRHAGHATSILEIGDIILDLASRRVTYKGATPPAAGARIRAALRLMERPGTILSRSQLEDRLYGWGEEVASNAVEVLIHYVRRKFDKDIIRNVRSLGWTVDACVR